MANATKDTRQEYGYFPESTVGNQGSRQGPALSVAKRTELRGEEFELHQRIAAKAYDLYLQGARTDGHDLDDWLEAEQIVLAQVKIEVALPKTKKFRQKGSRLRRD